MRSPEEFWEQAVKVGDKPTDCWKWCGTLHSTNVGHVSYVGIKTKIASRVAWILLNGDPGPGQEVRHACGRSLCVRPSHLFLAPRGDSRESSRAKQAATASSKPFCRNGHRYATVGFYISRGHRRCKACGKESRARSSGISRSTR